MLKFNEYINTILNECIILAKELNDTFILFKSRDRGYYSPNKIVHTIIDDVEVCYIEDLDSGWKEGMNEFGLGVINSRFSATEDDLEPKDQFKTKAYDKNEISKIQSEKEKYILDILVECKNTDEALKKIISLKKIKGITLVSDGKSLIEVEVSKDYGIEYKKHIINENPLDLNRTIVRTNHGVLIPDAGYQEKVGSMDRYSSEIRKSQTERFLVGNNFGITDIFNKLSQQPFEADSEMNTMRTSIKSKTGGQMIMDLNNLVFYYSPKDNENAFKGIDKQFNSEPKIRIEIV